MVAAAPPPLREEWACRVPCAACRAGRAPPRPRGRPVGSLLPRPARHQSHQRTGCDDACRGERAATREAPSTFPSNSQAVAACACRMGVRPVWTGGSAFSSKPRHLELLILDSLHTGSLFFRSNGRSQRPRNVVQHRSSVLKDTQTTTCSGNRKLKRCTGFAFQLPTVTITFTGSDTVGVGTRNTRRADAPALEGRHAAHGCSQ